MAELLRVVQLARERIGGLAPGGCLFDRDRTIALCFVVRFNRRYTAVTSGVLGLESDLVLGFD